MTERTHSKYSRYIFGAVVVVVLAIMFGVLGKTLAYFKTSGNNSEVYIVNTSILEDHHPKVSWAKDQIVDGRIVNDYMRADLEKAYIEAWYVANLSFANKDVTHLKDYFAGKALDWIKREVTDTSRFTFHQTELSHNLQLHHFTLDNQLAAFSDTNVNVIRKVLDSDSKFIYKEQVVFDYDVVMSLDDGRWRIIHLVKHIKSVIDDKNILATDTKMLEKLDRMKGVNYYPASTPWFDFWKNYSVDITKKDLRLAKLLGFNTVRIFLQYEVFGGEKVKHEMLERLRSFLDIAQEQKIKVVVTLFDFPKSYELIHYTSTDRHLEEILTKFKNHKAILAWDLKNEADLDFNNHGEQLVIDWLSFALKRARKYDPNHLITIGWSDANAAHHLHDELDFVSFHYYKKAQDLSSVIRGLKRTCNGKKIVLGEFGQTSLNSILTMYNRSEKKQAQYYSDIFTILKRENVPYISWALHDFDDISTEVFGSMPWIRGPQKHYGLIRNDGRKKPVASLIQD